MLNCQIIFENISNDIQLPSTFRVHVVLIESYATINQLVTRTMNSKFFLSKAPCYLIKM